MLSLREPLLVRSFTLKHNDEAQSYQEQLEAWNAQDSTGVCVRIEAENAVKTSSQMLYPVQDQSSAAVYPSSSRYLLNNTIGGNSWKSAGQWIEWKFTVPQDGYYCLGLYNQQNFVRGIDVSRRIMVDGVVPFSELEAYRFSYQQSWRLDTVGNGQDPYRIYLTAGEHTLRMEVVLGDMADII